MKEGINNWMLESMAVIGAFMVSVQWAVLYCSLLVLADTVTGILRSRKKKIPISSRKLGHTIGKWLVYVLALVVARGSMEAFGITDLDLVKIVLSGIAFVEVKSIDENIKDILGYSLLASVVGVFKRKNQDDEKVQ